MSDNATAIQVFEAMEKVIEENRDPNETTERIQRQIMEATSLEEILGERKVQSPDENPALLDERITIRSFEPRRGDMGWWVVIDAVWTETGEVIDPPIGTGGAVVLAQLARLAQLGAFDNNHGVRCMFTSRRTKGGFDVLRLVMDPADSPVDAVEIGPDDVQEGLPV